MDRRRPGSRAAAASALAGLALLAAGCGSPAPRAAGAGTTAAAADASGVAFSVCMRAHGVPGFPDPSGGKVVIPPGSGIDPDSPAFRAAAYACRCLSPKAGKPGSPAQQAKAAGQALRFAACMRANGVPDYPDPTVSAAGIALGNGRPSRVDRSSPAFRAARKACAHLLPGLPVTGG
jgi:hypothetical protein